MLIKETHHFISYWGYLAICIFWSHGRYCYGWRSDYIGTSVANPGLIAFRVHLEQKIIKRFQISPHSFVTIKLCHWTYLFGESGMYFEFRWHVSHLLHRSELISDFRIGLSNALCQHFRQHNCGWHNCKPPMTDQNIHYSCK